MREYERRYELNYMDGHRYPNLLRDGSGRVVSENITCFTLRKNSEGKIISSEILDGILKEMESEVKKHCGDAGLAYHDDSGNRRVFILLNSDPSKGGLKQMQEAYEEVYGHAMKWVAEYDRQIGRLQTPSN